MHIRQRRASTFCSFVDLDRRGSHGRRALLLANDAILIGVSGRGMAGSDGVHWAIAIGRIFHRVAGRQTAAWRKELGKRPRELN